MQNVLRRCYRKWNQVSKGCMLTLGKFYQKCYPTSFEGFRLAPLRYNDIGNVMCRNTLLEKEIMQVKNVLDSEGELV